MILRRDFRVNLRRLALICIVIHERIFFVVWSLVCVYYVLVFILEVLFFSDVRSSLETFQNPFFSCVEHNKKYIYIFNLGAASAVSLYITQFSNIHASHETEGTSKHLLDQRAEDVNLHAFSEFLFQSFVFIFIFRSYSQYSVYKYMIYDTTVMSRHGKWRHFQWRHFENKYSVEVTHFPSVIFLTKLIGTSKLCEWTKSQCDLSYELYLYFDTYFPKLRRIFDAINGAWLLSFFFCSERRFQSCVLCTGRWVIKQSFCFVSQRS